MLRDTAQQKATTFKATGQSNKADIATKLAEINATTLETIGEKNATALEKLADKFQGKAGELFAKIEDEILTEADIEDAEQAEAEPLPVEAASDVILVQFSVATQTDTLDAKITLEAPAEFDPLNPDFDLFFTEVSKTLVDLQAEFPEEITDTDPFTAITEVTVTLPDGTAFSQSNPFSGDDMDGLFSTDIMEDTLPEMEDDTDEDDLEMI